jgi:ADP-ribosylglycohydrolase
MIVGGSIGDALGAPVETWSPEKIIEVHGGPLTGYVPAIGHKWFKEDEFPLGFTTDDTQLTLATALGLIKAIADPPLPNDYMDAIAAEHCKAMKLSAAGWGGSTKDSIRNLQNGVHWSESGKSDKKYRGAGNGVPMKIAPLAVLKEHLRLGLGSDGAQLFGDLCVAYSAMTHYTKMSAYAAILQAETCWSCLNKPMGHVSATATLMEELSELWASVFGRFDVSHLNDMEDDLQTTMTLLWNEWVKGEISVAPTSGIEKRRELFGNGSCYVYNSLPFTYSFFLHHDNDNPVNTMLEIVNAGGDTDTNASMLGNLLGALYGIELFERQENRWTLGGLQGLNEIMDVANKLCDQFGIDDQGE